MKNGENQQLLLDLFRAYFDTRKNKRLTANALAFEAEYENNLFKLYRDIMNREYTIGRSVCFIVDKPVKREIFAADFRDRIVHHLIFNYINPIFEKHFIKDSYSCRIGKGTSQGIKRVDHFIRSCSENYRKECWILKLDVKGYFMAMDRNILYKKIERTLLEVKNANFDTDLVLYLLRAVIYNDPTKNFLAKGQREDWIGLPKSKSLFFAKEGKGFPVGNLTSQLFSNIYLDDFDHFVREEIGVKMYGRYVDDMVFIHHDKEFLKSIIGRVKEYLQRELQLTLHPKKIYLQNFKKGVAFLGTFVKPWRIYIGEKTKRNFYAKIKTWNEFAKEHRGLDGAETVKKFVASVNSYLGIMNHYRTRKLREKISKSFDREIFKSIVFSKGLEKVEVLVEKKKDEPAKIPLLSTFVQMSRVYLFVAMLFIGFAIQAVFPSVASAAYISSGTATSTNLISGSSASAITNFHYTLSSLPGNSSVTVQFSPDNSNWYSASGALNSSNTLSTTGGADLSITGGWSGTAFYYKLILNATSDLSGTPVMDDIRLDYTATAGYGNMFVFNDAGNAGIGTTTPGTYKLKVAGTVCLDLNADGVCTDTTSAISDARLKTNVTTITDGLQLIGQLRPVRFTWNGLNDTGTANSLGFLAQDVEAVFQNTDLVITDTAGYKHLDYGKLTAVLVSATQTLNNKVESILNGTATSTITNIAYQNASTTVTDTLCLGGDCRTAWTATASSTSPDFAGYVSTTTLASSLAGYALLTNIPDVSAFVSTSTLAASIASITTPDLSSYARLSDLASATSSIATLDTRLTTLEGAGYLTASALSDLVSTSTLASTLASYATLASLPDFSSFISTSTLASTLAPLEASLLSLSNGVPSASLSGTVTGSMIPDTHNAYDLGTNTVRFANVYAQNIHAGDLTFTETTSAVSGNTFQPGDTIGLYVTTTGATTHTVPIDFRTAINSTVYGANNVYFNTSGSLGIGIPSNTALRGKLDVEGAITAGSDSRFLTLANSSSPAALPYSIYIPGGTGDLTIASNDNSLGSRINTSYPVWQVGLSGESDSFSVNRAAAGAGAFTATNLFKIASNGNVGVGTTSPYAKLSVEGNIVMGSFNATSTTATSTVAGNLSVSGNINLNGALLQNNSPFIGSQWTTTGSDLYFSTGKVGIGSSTPSTNLSVQGNQYTSGTSFFGGAITATSTLTLSALATPAGTFLAADANGNIIATTSPISSIFADYPFTGNGTSGSHLALAFGTTTSNTWSGLQTFAGGINVPSGVLGYSMEGKLLAYASSTNQNTIFGLGAGGQNATTSASVAMNTAVGYLALNANTTGSANTANGTQALYFNTTGNFNTANGVYALYNNTTGSANTANGYNALQGNTSGIFNIGIGYNSGYNINTGYENIAIGHTKDTGGNNIITGYNNILLGYNAGIGTTTSSSNFLNIGNSFFGTMIATTTSTSLPTSFANVAFAIATSSFTGSTLSVQNSSTLNNVVSFFSNAGASLFEINDNGTVGVASTTPFGRLSVDTSSLAAGVPSFVVGSSTRTDLIVTQSGNIGVGTASPGYALDVAGSSAFGTGDEAMRIDSTGYVGIGTSTPYAPLSLLNNTTSLIDLFAIATSTSGIVFKVDSYGRTYGDGAYSSPAADYAEYFYTNSTNLQSGEVVCVDILENNAVKRCERGADNNVMGIVSTKPSVIGNYIKAAEANPAHYAIIGMMGQVDAYASAENGPISVGDSLTSASSTPGYAMRADASDSTVGIALEPLSAGTGRIKVLISRRNKSMAVEEVEALVVDRIANMKIEDKVQQLVKDATDKIVLTKLVVSGNVSANSYEMATTSATAFTFGSTTVMAEIPSAVLTANGTGVDLYKLATFTLAGVQALVAKFDAQDVRIVSLETRMTALESGAVSSASGSPITLGTTSLASAFEGFGALIQKGIAQFNTLVFRQLVASKDVDGTSSAGNESIPAGNAMALVTNSLVAPSTKVFVTFNTQVTGSWWVSDKVAGSFRVVLATPQTTDMTFDYFLVQTEGQIAASSPDGLGSQAGGSQTSNTNSGSQTSVSLTPSTATITVLGDNPMYISVDGVFADPGISVSDGSPYITFINGIEQAVSSTTITTTSATTYTITYQATDAAGNSSTATRTVIVGTPADTTTTTTASTTPADTTAPVVTLAGSAAMSLTVGDTFTDAGATATDDTDGDLTANIAVTGSVDTATAGSYTLTYSATDAAGNTGSASRLVTVSAAAPAAADTASSTPAI